ncbi:uncharacterized protein LOC144620658 [Crassostrea virginica]
MLCEVDMKSCCKLKLYKNVVGNSASHSVVCVFVLGSLGLVQGRGLLANLMKQAGALKHGLDLAWKVGDICSHRNEVAFTVVPSRSSTYSSGTTIAFNTVKTNHGNAFSRGNYRFTAPSNAYSTSFIARKPTNSAGLPLQSGSVKTASQVWVASAYSSIYVYSKYSSFSGWKIR